MNIPAIYRAAQDLTAEPRRVAGVLLLSKDEGEIRLHNWDDEATVRAQFPNVHELVEQLVAWGS